MSKPITAVAVLKLVQEGKLNLGDRPFAILDLDPASGGEPDPRMQEITVRNLLRHRGGFDRTLGLDPTLTPGGVAQQLGIDPPVSIDDIIRFMFDRPLDFDPGTRASYSNFGYAVLGRVIERVTGHRYEAWVRREVLAPAGSGGMVLARPFPDQRPADEVAYYHPPPPEQVPAIAPREGQVRLPDGGFDLGVMAAHGGWTATASDLVRFAIAVDGSSWRTRYTAARLGRSDARGARGGFGLHLLRDGLDGRAGSGSGVQDLVAPRRPSRNDGALGEFKGVHLGASDQPIALEPYHS